MLLSALRYLVYNNIKQKYLSPNDQLSDYVPIHLLPICLICYVYKHKENYK